MLLLPNSIGIDSLLRANNDSDCSTQGPRLPNFYRVYNGPEKTETDTSLRWRKTETSRSDASWVMPQVDKATFLPIVF
jgi:hypothetical protein